MENELKNLATRTFSIIELVEMLDIPDKNFLLIRKKLLDLGNDIVRVAEKGDE
jgi:hypothetical protein